MSPVSNLLLNDSGTFLVSDFSVLSRTLFRRRLSRSYEKVLGFRIGLVVRFEPLQLGSPNLGVGV